MLYWGMDLSSLLAHYRPSSEAIELVDTSRIALLVGISGAGKDTILQHLLQRPHFREIISHTTRPPRVNNGHAEQDGVEYFFIDSERAARMLAAQEFIEAKLVHGTMYGTSVAALERAARGGIAVTAVDVQGVAEYRMMSDKVIAIFIIPPSYDEWKSRLRRRYESDEAFLAEWPVRRATAIEELTRALEFPYYHCVINDSLDRAVEVVAEIASREDMFTRKDDEARLAARDLLEAIQRNAEV